MMKPCRGASLKLSMIWNLLQYVMAALYCELWPSWLHHEILCSNVGYQLSFSGAPSSTHERLASITTNKLLCIAAVAS